MKQNPQSTDQFLRPLLISYYQAYPLLEPADIFKYLYQSAFGCEHMVTDYQTVARYIQQELTQMQTTADVLIEPLAGAYSRVHLGYLSKGMSPNTLAKLFCLSATHEKQSISRLKEMLAVASSLVNDGTLPLDKQTFDSKREAWAHVQYAALHHSEAFRKAYHPAYRVIANTYIPYFPLLSEIDGILAIKGAVLISLQNCQEDHELFGILRQLYPDMQLLWEDQYTHTPDLLYDLSSLSLRAYGEVNVTSKPALWIISSC